MYPKNLKIMLILMALMAIVLMGCGSKSASSQEGGAGIGLANPASVYCQGLGYREETRENEAGQYGVCIFKDGSECDTWDFLAGRCGQEHSYCRQQGFELKSEEEKNIATCTFEDGSTCDEFSYFKGDCKPGDNLP